MPYVTCKGLFATVYFRLMSRIRLTPFGAKNSSSIVLWSGRLLGYRVMDAIPPKWNSFLRYRNTSRKAEASGTIVFMEFFLLGYRVMDAIPSYRNHMSQYVTLRQGSLELCSLFMHLDTWLVTEIRY